MKHLSTLALLFTWILIMVGCNPCADKLESEVVSPDKILKATSLVRNCGATTDFSTIVAVHRSDNTYRDEDIVFVVKGRGPLHLKWNGARQLAIECVGCQRKDIFKQVMIVGDVDVLY